MKLSTTGIGQLLADTRASIAVFDVAIRKHTDQWQLSDSVPLSEAIDAFRNVSACQRDDGRLSIPLHEDDTADLSGQYVIADPTTDPPEMEFYDFSAGGYVRYPISALETTYPAWRMRFWTSAYDPDEPPAAIDAQQPSDETVDQPSTLSGRRSSSENWIETVRSALVTRRDEKRAARRAVITSDAHTVEESDIPGLSGLSPGQREVDQFGQQVISLEIPDDHVLAGSPIAAIREESGLTAGDDVLIECVGHDGFPLEAELFELTTSGLNVGVYWGRTDERAAERVLQSDADVQVSVIRLIEATPFEAVESALSSLERTDRSKAVYAGAGTLRFSQSAEKVFGDDLNRYQQAAVTRALQADDLACIHAPPWTGARRVIRTIVERCVARDRTVGIFTPTVADLDRLVGAREDPTEQQASSPLFDTEKMTIARTDATDRSHSGNPWTADVVGIPLEGANLETDVTVDVGIIDQAARLDVGRAAVAFARADRRILIGDPLQLPSKEPLTAAIDGLPSSIYAHAVDSYGAGVATQLRCQYGMNQAIAMFPNRYCYDGGLIHGQRNRTWTIDTMPPLEPIQVPGSTEKTPTGSWYNNAEVERTCQAIGSVRRRGVRADDIGVIAPSSAQVGKLRAAINDLEGLETDEIMVGTPEQFTCRAVDVCIISLVLGSETGAERWTQQTLNVAMTRARKRLVLIGAWDEVAESDGPVGDLAVFLRDRGLLSDIE